MHRLISQKIRDTPELLQRVSENLARWKTLCAPSTQPYLLEWEQLVQQGMEACLDIAQEDSEHARTLRQSSPFAGLLSSQERFAFLRQWKQQQHAAQ